MRISKKYIKETIVELFTVEVECPYCEKTSKYRSLIETVWNAKCKRCKNEFIVDHGLDDADLLKIGYHVSYCGTRNIGHYDEEAVVCSKAFFDEHLNKFEDLIWIVFKDGEKFAVSIHDLKINRELNKNSWKK